MKKIIIALILLLPVTSFAQVPAFPMAFWGTATVDGIAAPAGATIRVYGGTSKIGEVTVMSGGVYGYTEPTKQKLLVEETTGSLSFTIQAPSINGGIETQGVVPITHDSFEAGETMQKTLDFELTTQVTSGRSSSGGGGSGGGGRRSSASTPAITQPLVLGQSTTTPATEEERRIQLQKQLITLLVQLVALLQQRASL